MPKGPKGEKRPADVIGNAVHVMRIATGQAGGVGVSSRKPKISKPTETIVDLATMDSDEVILLQTRKVHEARNARRTKKSQVRRSTKGK